MVSPSGHAPGSPIAGAGGATVITLPATAAMAIGIATPALSTTVSSVPNVNVRFTGSVEPLKISSLNVKTIASSRGTSTAPFSGEVNGKGSNVGGAFTAGSSVVKVTTISSTTTPSRSSIPLKVTVISSVIGRSSSGSKITSELRPISTATTVMSPNIGSPAESVT